MRKQALTVECRVDAQGEQACGKEAENEAADDASPACDQTESGNGCSGDRVGNGSSEGLRLWGCFDGGTRRCGGLIGELPAPRTLLRLFWHQHPLKRDPEWKPAPQYVPDRLIMACQLITGVFVGQADRLS